MIDELPISVEEIAPAFLIVPMLEPAQQTTSGRNGVVPVGIHFTVSSIEYCADEPVSFKKDFLFLFLKDSTHREELRR